MKAVLFVLLTLISSVIFANLPGKPYRAEVAITDANALAMHPNQTHKKVYLINWQLTADEKNFLQNDKPFVAPQILPREIFLGMNHVPVLDQGAHPTCVTFALGAMIDALEGRGDEVSELCSLELGNFLFPRGYESNAWQGSDAYDVIKQMRQFGFITKAHEPSKICGGLAEYPLNDEDQMGTSISLTDARKISEDLVDPIYPEFILTNDQSWHDHKNHFSSDKVLFEIKKQLVSGVEKPSHLGASRLVAIGVQLPMKHCNIGACGKYHLANDTWTLSNEIKKDPDPQLGGHEMIVMGYDDNAIAIDADGLQHQGLLTLRSSWGDSVGDHGNFYMSYDFFKQYVGEATALIRVANYYNKPGESK